MSNTCNFLTKNTWKWVITPFLVEQPKPTLRIITNNCWVACEYKKKSFQINSLIWIIEPCTQIYTYAITFPCTTIHFPVLFFWLHRLPQKYNFVWKKCATQGFFPAFALLPCISTHLISFVTPLSSLATAEVLSRDWDQTLRTSCKHHRNVQDLINRYQRHS